MTSNTKAWIVRIGEHNLHDQLTHHSDIAAEKIILYPIRNGKAGSLNKFS